MSRWVVSILMIAGVGVAALTSTATASVSFPGKNGRIAVVVTNPKDAARPTDVMTMGSDGSHRKLITHTRAGRDAGPTNIAFSPDGRRIVFDRRACPDGCRHNVGVMSSSGSKARLLTHRRRGFDTNFGFSRNGSRVGFTRDGRDIFVVGARGGRPKRLTRYAVGVAATDPSFSRDGKSVLFHKFVATRRDGTESSSDTICLVAIASRQETCLGQGSSPLWAPSGRAILFTSPDSSGIYKMRPDGSRKKRLIAGSRMRPLAFSPNGKHFTYLRETSTGRRLYVAKSDGTHRRALTHDRKDFEDNLEMAFSPNSKKVIYLRDGRKAFYVSPTTRARPKRILVTPRQMQARGGTLAWAPRA